VYFNFSGVKGLVLLSLLPKMGKSVWGLTLHNGDLDRGVSKYLFSRILMKIGLNKCDLIGTLSSSQDAFFRKLGVNKEKLHAISSFIPRDWNNIDPPSFSEFPEIIEWVNNGDSIFIVSGYPTVIYQHEKIFETFEKLWQDGYKNIRLVAFLYGSDSDGILKLLRARFESTPYAKLHWEKNEMAFLSALNICSGYIRMNTVDSYGLAVAEAISLGKPVLASNVCERFNGANLIDPSDFKSVSKFVIDVQNGNLHSSKNTADNSDVYVAINFLEKFH
jgi:glycosyltransferase involved in cell wall biosynthesis